MKKKTKILLIIITSFVLLGIILGFIDYNRIKNKKMPIFTIQITNRRGINDNYIGLGYRFKRTVGVSPKEPIMDYQDLKFGLWFYVWNVELNDNKKSDDSDDTYKKNRVQSDYLFSLKTPFIGNNSAVSSLIEELEISKLGSYTIELKTDEKPYALTIKFDEMVIDVHDADISDFKSKMKMYGIILLALIENADEIRYNNRYCDCIDNIVSLNVDDLHKEYGNIKEYGKSREDFYSLLIDIGLYPITSNKIRNNQVSVD